MAIRKIVTEGDEILGKQCRRVEKFDARLHQLLDDMKETLKAAQGAGLAAPQVGVLRQMSNSAQQIVRLGGCCGRSASSTRWRAESPWS